MTTTSRVLVLAAALATLGACQQRNDAQSQATPPAAAPAPSAAATPAPADPAANTTMAPSTASATLAEGDRTFMERAAQGGLAEVAATAHAREKAEDGAVRETAMKLHDEHQKANAELKQIADARGATLPTQPDDAKRAEIDKLRTLSGAELDREFLRALTAWHKDTIALYETASRDGSDPQVRAFAEKTLPALREHLQMVEGLHGAIKPAAAPDAAPTPRS